MKVKPYPYLLLCFFIIAANSVNAQFTYISPMPGAKYLNPETGIILSCNDAINENSLLNSNLFTVNGSISGNHTFQIKMAEQGKTILLRPDEKFMEGETVTVNISDGLQLQSGQKLNATSFQFSVRAPRTAEQNQHIAAFMKEIRQEDSPPPGELKPPGPNTGGLPDFTILTNTTTSSGDIFFSDFNFYITGQAFYCVIKNNGDSVYGKMDTTTFNNFDLNKNGFMTAYNEADSVFVMLDSNYAVAGIYQMGNGYKSDVHEFKIFPDGTHYMLCYDPQIVDMTVYNPLYNPAATVVGCVLQKLDAHNNVLFEWRSWDHFGILDADHINFANAEIDDVHSNAIDVDNDGNILLTSRHLSEITKINSTTGDIIWRFGGGTQNQFTFTNDADKISWPHDGRRIADGNITVFDNGNYHSPPTSYAKEYQLDEVNKTATLVWSYKRTTPQGDIFSKAMGDVQRLSNGNTLICWGLVNSLSNVPKVTELDPLGNIVWEMQLADQDAVYRAHRYDWVPCARPSNSSVSVSNITSTGAKFTWKAATNASSYDVQYRKVGTTTWTLKNFGGKSAKVKMLTPSTKYEYQIRSHCNNIPTQLSAWTSSKKFKTLPQKVSLDEESGYFSSVLYPNPTQNDLMITISTDVPQSITISVFDASGKLMLTKSQEVDDGDQQIQIDASSLPGGFYFAEVSSPSGKEVKKFIKQ